MIIKNATIFDGHSEKLNEGDIRIVDGQVVELGKVAASDDQIIDAAGKFVIPGMIDAHFHAYGASLHSQEMEGWPMSYLAAKASQRLANALSRGFTSVRDVAGGDIGLGRAIEQGLIKAPRYFYSGAGLSQTGGHGDPRDPMIDVCIHHARTVEVVDGIDAIRAAVRERIHNGASVIKIFTSGGVVSLTDPIRIPQYTAEEVRAATDEAARRGIYVAAHAYSPEAIIHSVTNGVRTIEHANLLDNESAKAMAKHNAYMVPTLATYEAMTRFGRDIGMPEVSLQKNAEVFASGKDAVDIAKKNGVKIGFGTDLMGELEREQLNGLRLMSDVMTPLELLRAVTSTNAEILQRADLGRVSVGSAGDLILLPRNPLVDVSALWDDNRTIIKSGVVI